MPIEHKLIRCEPDAPNRCQSVGANGQCPYTAMEGYKYCERHNGTVVRSEAKERVSQYRLQVWQERLNEFASDDKLKSLRDEIGILRMTLEHVLNSCKNANDLVMYSPKIADLTSRIERLVATCAKMDVHMGSLMDKSAALNFAGRVVEIISQHVKDPQVIDDISNSIIAVLSEVTHGDQ